VLITYYRCDLHGEGSGTGMGESTAESAVCTPFVGDRIATEDEARQIPFEDSFCEGFG
jgi:hypothetical protein